MYEIAGVYMVIWMGQSLTPGVESVWVSKLGLGHDHVLGQLASRRGFWGTVVLYKNVRTKWAVGLAEYCINLGEQGHRIPESPRSLERYIVVWVPGHFYTDMLVGWLNSSHDRVGLLFGCGVFSMILQCLLTLLIVELSVVIAAKVFWLFVSKPLLLWVE